MAPLLALDPQGGPIATTVSLAENPAVQSYKIYQPKPNRKLDPNFGIETETFGKEVVFVFEIALASTAPKGPVELTANSRYQSCTDRQCLPPRKVQSTATLTVDPAAPPTAPAIPLATPSSLPQRPQPRPPSHPPPAVRRLRREAPRPRATASVRSC